jgi:hypothetical protein
MNQGPSGAESDVATESSALTTTATQSLVITDLQVTRNTTRTQDPCNAAAGAENKVWTIGHLLKREAEKNGLNPETYATNWINAWSGTVTINGQTVPPLIGPSVRTWWQRFAGGGTALPLHKAPFYLLAIVSRLDLRKHRPNGEPLGGEVRFVFGVLAANEVNPPCPTLSSDGVSTLIFEYSPAKTDENQVQDFGRRWLDLSTLTGSAYRSALQTLTEEVVNSGRLLRIRTNESPGNGEWTLGEFEPNATTKYMQRSTIKQSPTMALAGGTSQQLSDWIWQNRSELSANAFDFEIGSQGNNQPIASYWVPNTFPGTSTFFRGSLNLLPGNPPQFWTGPVPTGTNSEEQAWDWPNARFRFSVGTCRGCHGQDAGANLFHIQPTTPGEPPVLSRFLNGENEEFVDPANPDFRRVFNEMYRRETDLRKLVNGSPVLQPIFGNNYKVRFENSSKCLDSAGNNQTNGAFSQLYACHGNGNQRLSLVSVGSGVYQLKYKHSGKCIDVQNGSASNGARVVQNTCNSSTTSQRLTLESVSGVFAPAPRVLRFQHSSLCLVVQNQGTANGTAIVQGTCPASGEATKGFYLVE